MKEDDIPVKTSRGAMEIKTRALGLAARLRTILLLVDGVRTVGELERLGQSSGAGPEALASLLEKGLIALPPQPAPSPEAALPEQALPGPPAQPIRQQAVPPAPARQVPVPTAPAAPEASLVQPPLRMASDVPKPFSPAEAQDPAEQKEAPSQVQDAAGTAFLAARAHLAAALDEHVGFGGYALKQKVMDCQSVQELISHFDDVEERLIAPLGIGGATDVIRRAITILQMH